MGFIKRESNDWELALEDIEHLVDLCEAAIVEIGDPVIEYATSVRDYAQDVKATIEANQRVTPGQRRAIKNQTEGISKWQPRE